MNDDLIGKGNTRILADGNEVTFGLGRTPKENEPEYSQSHRATGSGLTSHTRVEFIYRDLVSEKRALYKQYDLSIPLGKGSYARVYKALQKSTGNSVAVKMIDHVRMTPILIFSAEISEGNAS